MGRCSDGYLPIRCSLLPSIHDDQARVNPHPEYEAWVTVLDEPVVEVADGGH
jgi:hypothetical protein